MNIDIFNESYKKYYQEILNMLLSLAIDNNLDYDELYMQDNLNKLLNNDDFKLLIAINNNNVLVGTLGAYIHKSLYNPDDLKISELFFYVKEKNVRATVGLIDYLENITNTKIEIEFDVFNKKLIALLQKKGYKIQRTVLNKEIL
jgi:hypothetical protein